MNLNQEMDKRNEASISEQRSRRDSNEMGVQADDFPELDALQEIHDTLLEES